MSVSSTTDVWVVDDNADVRFFFERAFQRLGKGASVSCFADGTELLAHVRTGHRLPNVLLMDMEMPKMDGLTALKALSSEMLIGQTAILMCSSVEESKAVTAAYSAGARLFIRKPLTMDEFLRLATLCSESAEELRELPALDLPFGVVDVKRASDLIRARAAAVVH